MKQEVITNKSKRVALVAALMLLFGSIITNAQSELSLKEAINFALKHKVDAQKAQLDIENSEYQIQEVRSNALPQLNATGGLTYNALLQQTALNMNGENVVIKMGTPWTTNGALQLNQELFNLSVFQGLKAARSTREFYILNKQLTDEQIIEKVANSYFDVYKTRSQITTINSTVENTTRVKDVIASLEENGLAKKIDLDRINVTLNNLKSSRTQLQNALALQENALKYLIGMEISKPINLPEGDFSAPINLFVKEDFNINNRTEIKLLEKQGELLQLNKKSIEASRYPSLRLTGNYGAQGLGENFPYFANGDRSVNWSDYASVGLSLNVPIFKGFYTRSKIRQAQVEIDRYKLDLQDTKLALNLGIENAFTQINNSVMTLNDQNSNKNLASEVLDNIENNYKNGLASLTDLLDAENSYADAQNNYTNALIDYKLAEVQLVKAKGELKTFYTQNK